MGEWPEHDKCLEAMCVSAIDLLVHSIFAFFFCQDEDRACPAKTDTGKGGMHCPGGSMHLHDELLPTFAGVHGRVRRVCKIRDSASAVWDSARYACLHVSVTNIFVDLFHR